MVNNHKYTSRRLRVRGHGKALQFKVTSVANKNFKIIGWAALESLNRMP